jgi:hypothetical protein
MATKTQKRVITLRSRQNHQFLEQSQGAIVTGATLPNGYKVPNARKGYAWVVRRRSLYLQKAPAATPAPTASAWNWGGSNMSPKR